MNNGDKVHIVSTVIPGIWNKPREMIFTYVGEDDKHVPPIYLFSARPEAGTQEVPKKYVARMVRVAKGTPIMMPRIKR